MKPILSLCLILLLAACGQSITDDDTLEDDAPLPDAFDLADGQYVLTPTGMIELPEGHPLEFSREGERIAGGGLVNRWMGQLKEDGTLGPLASTMMAGPEELMLAEILLLQALEGAVITERNGKPVIYKDGNVLFHLEPKQ